MAEFRKSVERKRKINPAANIWLRHGLVRLNSTVSNLMLALFSVGQSGSRVTITTSYHYRSGFKSSNQKLLDLALIISDERIDILNDNSRPRVLMQFS